MHPAYTPQSFVTSFLHEYSSSCSTQHMWLWHNSWQVDDDAPVLLRDDAPHAAVICSASSSISCPRPCCCRDTYTTRSIPTFQKSKLMTPAPHLGTAPVSFLFPWRSWEKWPHKSIQYQAEMQRANVTVNPFSLDKMPFTIDMYNRGILANANVTKMRCVGEQWRASMRARSSTHERVR